METINQNPDKTELRKFGLIFAVTALVFPAALRPDYKIWIKIGHVLGWINTRIILDLVFFVMFAPIALLFRVFGRDPMHCRLDGSPSYRKPTQPTICQEIVWRNLSYD